jgi:hypothetical protein
MRYVYYCRTYYKAVRGGGRRRVESHIKGRHAHKSRGGHNAHDQ